MNHVLVVMQAHFQADVVEVMKKERALSAPASSVASTNQREGRRGGRAGARQAKQAKVGKNLEG